MLPTREELDGAAARYGLDRVEVTPNADGGHVVRVERGAVTVEVVIEAADLVIAFFPAELVLRTVRLIAARIDDERRRAA